MKNLCSLSIPKDVLVSASGIDTKIIEKDIASGLIITKDKYFIWYRDAIQYVFRKWEEGKTKMYDPHGVGIDNSIQARILSRMDDEIGCGNLTFLWKE